MVFVILFILPVIALQSDLKAILIRLVSSFQSHERKYFCKGQTKITYSTQTMRACDTK